MKQCRKRLVRGFFLLLFIVCGCLAAEPCMLQAAIDNGIVINTDGYFTIVIDDEATGKKTTQKVKISCEKLDNSESQRVELSLSGANNPHNLRLVKDAAMTKHGSTTYEEKAYVNADGTYNTAKNINGITVYQEAAYTIFEVKLKYDRNAYTYVTTNVDKHPFGTRFNSYVYDWQCSNAENTLNKAVYHDKRTETFTLQINLSQTGTYIPGGAASSYNATYTINIKNPTLEIHYDGNGATSSNDNISKKQIFTYKNDKEEKGDPWNFSYFDLERKNYEKNTSAEWNTKANGNGTSYDQNEEYTIFQYKDFTDGEEFTKKSLTLYAQWRKKAKEYKVTLKKGTGISSVSGQGTYAAGDKVKISAVVKNNYSWSKWSGNYTSTKRSYSFTMPEKNVTMTANAKLTPIEDNTDDSDDNTDADEKKATLVVRPNGGIWNGSGANRTFARECGSTMSIPLPSIENYTATFVGNGGTAERGQITTNRRFSIWSRTNTNGSMSSLTARATYTFSSKPDTTDTIKAVYSGSIQIKLPDAYRTGYTFSGWYTSEKGGSKVGDAGDYVELYDDETYYAQWTPNTYTLSFHPNDGEEVIHIRDITITYDTMVDLPDAMHTSGTDAYVKYTLDGVNITKQVVSGVIVPAMDGVLIQPKEEAQVQEETQLMEEPQADKKAYKSVFMGWSLPEEKYSFIPQWKAGQVSVNEIVDAAGVTDEKDASITLYAIWDDCPWIKARHLYYTLEQAQSGFITEAEILSYMKAYDREDGSPIRPGFHENGTSFSISDYREEDFMQFVYGGRCTENLTVVDSTGSVYVKQIIVHITDTSAVAVEPEGITRFIDEYYYNQSYENGGLEEASLWKTEPEYTSVIRETFENIKNDNAIMTYYLTHEEIKDLKDATATVR